MAQIRVAILAIFCCALTAVNAQQKVQADSVLVPTDIADDERGTLYADFVKGSHSGCLNIGLEYMTFYTPSGFSGRIMMDFNLGGFDSEGLFGLRFGYNLGYNIFRCLSVHGLAALGFGTYSGIKEDDEHEYEPFDEEDTLYSFNSLTLSCGSTVNFSYFYPITLYLKAEILGLTGGGFYPSVGGGVKYSLRSKK